jgi:drug/metabolite transporter (DMT)-like permease
MGEGWGIAAAAATGVQVGAAMVVTRLVAQDIGPFSLALLRYAIGLSCLLPFAFAFARARIAQVRIAGADWAPILALGTVQFGLLIAFLNYGLRFVPAGRASLLFATFPIMTMILGAALGREPMTLRKAAGVALTFLGVAATLGEGLFVETAPGEWSGALAVLGAALCGAICSIFYRPYLNRYPTLPIGAIAMAAAVAFLFVPALGEGLFRTAAGLDLRVWAAVVFIGLSSGLGYLLWLSALRHTTPTQATLFLSLSPVVAALLGAAFLGEALTGGTLAGIAGVLSGLWVATRRSQAIGGAAP